MNRTWILYALYGATMLTWGCDGESQPSATPRAESTAEATSVEARAPAEPSQAARADKGQPRLHPTLTSYVQALLPAVEAIPQERKQQLKKLALFVRTKTQSKEPAKLVFICTHNSRRSHMGQLWAATAAAYYDVDGVTTFSGGTEATAFNPRAVAALRRAGFQIKGAEGDNPHYMATFAPDGPTQECFSKKYDDAFNPKENFAAVMTCSQADKSCPFVQGAALRVPIPYVDPKVSDGTPEEAATYDKRAKQIATEMFYLFSQVNA